jgi:hypothetical protein
LRQPSASVSGSLGCRFFAVIGSHNCSSTTTQSTCKNPVSDADLGVLHASRLHTCDTCTRTRTTCTHKVLFVLFLHLFCPPCPALHQPALPQPTRSKDEGLVPAHLPMLPRSVRWPYLAYFLLGAGGVIVALSALCVPAMHASRPCPVPFWESTRQSRTMESPGSAHASVLDMLLRVPSGTSNALPQTTDHSGTSSTWTWTWTWTWFRLPLVVDSRLRWL